MVKRNIYSSRYLYFLLSRKDRKVVQVSPDWGKFLILSQNRRNILDYNKDTAELRTPIRLPGNLEMALSLYFGDFTRVDKQ